MARFNDTLSSLGVGEDGISVAYPDTFVDDITSAYNEDTSVYEAKIGVLEADLAAANGLIAELKAHNYDLLKQVPTAVTPDESADENETPDPEEDDSEEQDDLDRVFAD